METGNLSHIAPTIWSADDLLDMEQPNHQQTFGIAASSHQQAEQLPSGMSNLRKRKRTNSAKPKRAGPVTRERDWTDAETSALLKFVNKPEFRPQRRTRSTKTHWELIVEAIQRELGANSAITVKRCKERMKTLTGERYYKLVTSTWERKEREKDNPTEDDLRNLIESCGLTVDWYEAIKQYKAFQGPGKGQGRSRMQMHCDIVRNSIPDGPDRPSSSLIPTLSDQFEPVQPTSPQSLEELITNPICGLHQDSLTWEQTWWSQSIVSLESQPTSPQSSEELITNPIAERFNSLKDSQRSTLLDLIFGAEFFKERAKTFEKWEDNPLSKVCDWLSIVQKRRDLAIYEDVIALEKMRLVSWEYDDEMGEGSDHDGADISGLRVDFESLRAYKKFFKKVMERHSAYDTRRRIQDEAMVKFDARRAPSGVMMLHLCECKELEVVDLSGFRKLRWLSIWECLKLREMIGWECLEELGWLEMWLCPLYDGYPPLQKIPSLQEVYFWPGRDFSTSSPVSQGGELDVSGCVRLRRLQMGDETLSSIRGLEGLSSLTALELYALRNLPDIGHMKYLTHLTIYRSAVEEIKGVEKLSSLEELNCLNSELKTLPDLRHLPHLRRVALHSCPVVKDPSSPYYEKTVVEFDRENKHVDVSDTSDRE